MHALKKNWLLAVLIGAGLASCKEKGPVIDFGTIAAIDTTYMGAAPSPQTRAFLIEDFSGIQCSNCPRGHQFVTTSESQYPGRIVPMTIHVFAPGNSTSYPHSDITPVIDFRTQDGTSIFENVFNSPSALPTIGISRTQQAGNIQISNWAQQLSSLITTTTPVNVDLTSTYDVATSKGLVKVTVSYTAAVSKKQSLTIALVEDAIIAPQDTPDPNTGGLMTDTTYTHNHILRKIFTVPTGSAMIDSIATKAPGRIYQRTFNIAVDAAWNSQNCKVIAFVSNNEPGDKEVLQATEIKLRP